MNLGPQRMTAGEDNKGDEREMNRGKRVLAFLLIAAMVMSNAGTACLANPISNVEAVDGETVREISEEPLLGDKNPEQEDPSDETGKEPTGDEGEKEDEPEEGVSENKGISEDEGVSDNSSVSENEGDIPVGDSVSDNVGDETVSDGDIEALFEIEIDSEDNATIKKYIGTDTEVVIPSEYSGHKVTKIYSNAFYNKTSVTSVILPDTLESIGSYAFQGCTSLTRMVIPKSVTDIGSSAFNNSISQMEFESGMTKIPANACRNANRLTTVSMPSTITEIGSYAFANSSVLEEIAIPASVKTVGYDAFYYASALKELTFGDDVTIGNRAFYNCSDLEKLTIGDRAIFGSSVVAYCDKLYTLIIGDDATFDDYAFRYWSPEGSCGSDITWNMNPEEGVLYIIGSGDMDDYTETEKAPWIGLKDLFTIVVMEDGVTSIGNNAFLDCDKLTDAVIPESVDVIGESAFSGCSEIKYMEVPESVDQVGRDAMKDCASLEEIVFCGDAPTLGTDCLPNQTLTTAYYPETGSGWSDRVTTKYPLLSWTIWDNTVPTKDVVLLLDHSGSMSGRMDTLHESAAAFTNGMNGRLSNTRISVVAYDNTAEVKTGLTTNRSYLEKEIYKLKDEGGTEYQTALRAADGVLQSSNADFKAIVMFSDGEPNDSKTAISALASELRKKYHIYTVGLLSSESQKQVLVDVAGSEERYFEASNIKGLLKAFLDLVEDIGKSETTTAEIKRHNKRYDLFSETVDMCVGVNEIVSILITPGTKVGDVKRVAIVQNGKAILENSSGEFDLIVPGKLFQKDTDIYEVCYDGKGKELERQKLKLNMKDGYVLTFKKNDGTVTVYKTMKVLPGVEIPAPEDPVRYGYKFSGWYSSQDCKGISFFSIFNYYNRMNIEHDTTLYAKWRVDGNVLDLSRDVYQFTNSHRFFCMDTNGNYDPKGESKPYKQMTKEEKQNYQYQITDGDFNKLLSTIDSWRFITKSRVKNGRLDEWGGSCFGMSSTVCLAKDGDLDITSFDSSINNLGQASLTPNDTFADVGSIESMINYYFLQQNIGSIYEIRNNISDESSNIKRICDKLEQSGTAVNMTINLLDTSTGKRVGGHSVVAYNYQKSVSGNGCTFDVYDCAQGPIAYPVVVTVNNGVYTASCSQWETDWKHDIFFKTALTVDELMDEPMLVAPETIEGNSSYKVAETSDTYSLETSYDDFEITGNGKSAVISDGERVSGDLNITCYGNNSELDAAPKYLYEVPALGDNDTYVIQIGSANSCRTVLINDSMTGFYSSVESEHEGTITFTAKGKATTSFGSDCPHKISVSKYGIQTPWYLTGVEGNNTGMTVGTSDSEVAIASASNTKVKITLESDANEVVFSDVDVTSDGISITSNNNRDCVIKDKSGNEVTKSAFGYSVVFDGQQGSTTPTLQNVTSGSLIQEPSDPRRDGYIFEGWFKESACSNLWDFAKDKVTDDVVLYAGWSLDPNYFVTVTFKSFGEEDQIVSVAKGNLLRDTDCPTAPAGVNPNWYKDKKCTSVWDFAKDKVMQNIVLYRQGLPCTVSFDSLGGGDVASVSTNQGCYLDEPESVSRNGFTLCGWTDGIDADKDWDFEEDCVKGDMILYARWVENEKDKESNDTGICIDIKYASKSVYTGKPVIPSISVRDGNQALTLNKDYKVSYKNNIYVCDATRTDISSDKKPQIIVQGIGSYKNSKKFVKYFSIRQADMKNLKITMPDIVMTKPGNALQTVKPVVSTSVEKVNAKNYTVSYYTDAACQQSVKGITTAGSYYVVVEAKKDNSGAYTGSFCGKSAAFRIVAATKDKMLEKGKLTLNKNIKCTQDKKTSQEAIAALISQVKVGSDVYKTSDMATFLSMFTVYATDANGTYLGQKNMGSILKTAGKKTIVVSALDGNAKQYCGKISAQTEIRGVSLKKNDFKVSYDVSGNKAVTSTEFTGKTMIPSVYSKLRENKDYRITYQKNKKEISKSSVLDAGNYVITFVGMNQYSGKVSVPFRITKVSLAKAAQNGQLTISANEKAEYSLAGAKVEYTVDFDADKTDGKKYARVSLKEGDGYSVSFKNNKKISKKKAYGILKGKGNFTGKVNATEFEVTKRDLDSDGIKVQINGFKMKKGKIKSVAFKIYDHGKLIPKNQYKASASEGSSTVYLSISSTNKNYTGSIYVRARKNLIKANDSKKVIASLKVKDKIYYDGEQKKPEVIVVDAAGADISSMFDISYGDNCKVGMGTVVLNGKVEYGYCGSKTIRFAILPKWMKWIFG